jgi:arylsulfatase A-like enzyme
MMGTKAWKRGSAALASALLWSACSKPPPPAPEHVLFVLVDTLRADHLGVFGYERPTSPNLDRLASQGVLCTQAISQCSYTSPSMVSLMTGRYIGRERLDIPTRLATLAESFAAAGWATAGFASNPLITAENGFARGFERFEPIIEYSPNTAIEDWLAARGSQRTFTYVHITEPHDPYRAPEGQREWLEQGGLLPGDRGAFYDRAESELGLEGGADMRARIASEIGGYDDDVRYADWRVGELLALYERAGLRERTLVAVTADHGEGLWQHIALLNGKRGASLRAGEKPSLVNTLHMGHGNQVHHELVHVPMILSGPGLPAGKRITSLVENVDLFPTLLELAGLRPPEGLQGQSLLRRLEGSGGVKQHAFSYTRFNVTVIDAEGWALILPTEEGECAEGLELELFHLRDDPHQRHDVADRHPDVVERLKRVAEQRLAISISEQSVVTDDDMAALDQLGYIDVAGLEVSRRAFAQRSTAELVADLTQFRTPCHQRLLAAESLAGRELDADQRARLADWRKQESSSGVKRALDAVLGL